MRHASHRVVLALFLGCLAGLIGCRESSPKGIAKSESKANASKPTDWFEDITETSGIEFVHDCGQTGNYFMPQTVGSGCAVFDADGDGKLDLFFLQNAGPESKSVNQLYQQVENGKFANVTTGSGLDIAGYNMGVAVADINQDGLPDVLITQYRGARLFLNRGALHFEDITKAAGIENPLWGTSASFVDYNRDGRVDLIITNYVDLDPSWTCTDNSGQRDYCGPNYFNGTASRLFRNLGPKNGAPVVFEDVSLPSGIAKLTGPGLGVFCADLSGDGWVDFFIANDEKPNRLWVNQKNGTFVDEAVARGIAFNGMGQVAANMGVAPGDIDNDGLIDLFVTHLTNEMHTMWKQGPAGVFSDRTLAAGLVSTKWRGTGFGALMADFDQDGLLDLSFVNGRIARGPKQSNDLAEYWRDYGERNQILRNLGGGKYEDYSEATTSLCGKVNVARGLASGDLNGDGKPDLVVTCISGKPKILMNRSTSENHWLAIRTLNSFGSDAVGAEVRLKLGEKQLLRLCQPAESFECSSSPEVLFGLGATTKYDGIEVRWPDGKVENFPGGESNQRIKLKHGSGK
jgi:enediyne biosynthesis protein E4